MNRVKRMLAVFTALFLLFSPVIPVRADSAEANQAVKTGWQAYDGKRIGVLTGTLLENIAAESFPNSERLYFDSYPDLSAALLSGKIDAFLADEPNIKMMHYEQPALGYFPDKITRQDVSFAFRKNDEKEAALCEEFNAFLKKIREDGTFDEIDAVWMGTDEAKKTVDMSDLTGENGTIRVVTTATDNPWSYIRDGKNVGYDIDIVTRFCRDRGYALELLDVDFSGRISAVQSGKCDFCTGMNVTDERKEQVLFSDPTYDGGIVLAVPSRDLSDDFESDTADPEFSTFEQLNGKTISMLTGAPFEELISSKVQHVKEFTYYQTMPDMVLGIKSRKTDAGFMNNAVAELAANKDPEIAVFPESLGETAFGLAFKKGDARCRRWQEAYDRIPAETKTALWEKWTGSDETVKTVPEQDWPGTNGTVQVAACDALEPMSYVGQDGELLGLDIETILLIARELDVHLEFTPMDFSAVLSSIGSGKADIGCGSIVTTDERKETMDFVEYQKALYVLVVRAGGSVSAGNSFFDGVKESFYKTFIRENRYQLFIQGIITTLIITALAILFGTALGFLVYMLCRNGGRIPDIISRFFVWLIQGMPVVVLLMILYYIIFAKTQMSGTVVAVIAFTLVFGAAVFGMLKMGVGAVDHGQKEAALALGYGNLHAFFRIILPQALPHFLPAYKGEVVSLIKATAIVGYIAVQDLTKMGDIVRGRTYEAFFPLIAVAVIYFLLGGLLTFAVGRIEKLINPRRRKKETILKGVQQRGVGE
ncbi:MAG: transporter substrate-binding domain-containing protein [Eubacterium sp.]|nr:transporter substrate-binding domain-containing protein [Eubacterium sp.]